MTVSTMPPVGEHTPGFIDTEAEAFRRALLNELVAPRPVGWISTLDSRGRANLAPFSHFNVVSSAPPIIMFSCNTPEDRALKDTISNVMETEEFVVNMASFELREAMVATSAQMPPEVDEFESAQLEKLPSCKVRPPRVARAPAQMECRLWHVMRIEAGDETESESQVIFGKVVGIHMRPDLVDDQGRFRTVAAQPIARLGGIQYLTTTDVFELPRKFRSRS